MTRPHPALLHLARSERVGSVDDERALLRSAFEHRMVAALLNATANGHLVLSREAATTASIWRLAEQRRHLGLWATVAEAQQRLAHLDADVCVLKGVATEWRWYGRLGERVSTDVDLLLAPAALGQVVEVVRAMQPDRTSLGAIGALTRHRMLQHVDLVLEGVQVDLHFDPLKVGIATRQLETLWAATEVLDTPYGTIRVLRPEHELVLLLLHLNKDRFAYLGPLLDVRRLLERADLDWPLVTEFVRNEGLGVPVYESLAAVAETLDLPIDVAPPAGWLRRRTWRVLWGPRRRLGGDEARLRAPRVQRALVFHSRGRPRDAAREVRRQLLPPRELLEVAGRLEPGGSYLRARRSRANADGTDQGTKPPGRRRWPSPRRPDESAAALQGEENP